MTFLLSYIDRGIINGPHFVLFAVVVASIKGYLFDLFVYLPLFGNVLL